MSGTGGPLDSGLPNPRLLVVGMLMRLRCKVEEAIAFGLTEIVERRRERRDRRVLQSMSDRELRDLGISRYEIDALIRRERERERER